jgi:acetolactate decarboxylase
MGTATKGRTAMTILFNVNTRSAYEAGGYTGSHRIEDLLKHGDFGLGALHENDGDLVVVDGSAYRTSFEGFTEELTADATSSYATVIPFTVDRSFEVYKPLGREQFEEMLAGLVPLADRIWAVRIRGVFTLVVSGASRAQARPYRPLAEVLPTYNFQSHADTAGTMVGFHSPASFTGVGVVGPHYHWLSDDRGQGGHATRFVIDHAVVELCEADAFAFELPTAGRPVS